MITLPITVRAATVDDVPFMQEMLWEALLSAPEFMARVGVEKLRQEENSYWHNWLNQPDPAFIALGANGQKIGAITVKPNEKDGERVKGWRLGIGLVAEARGQRIGQLLIEHALEFARTKNAEYVNLLVANVNTRGINLYRRCGFTEIGEKDGIIEMKVNL